MGFIFVGLGAIAVGCGEGGRRGGKEGGAALTAGPAGVSTGGPGSSGGGASDPTAFDSTATSVGSTAGPGATGAPLFDHGGGGADDGGPMACPGPQVLIVLDRTQSMHRRPDESVPDNTAAGRMESKWFIAIDAIERFTGEFEASVWFGLELFPRESVTQCVTLQQRIAGATADNPACQGGEIVLSPGPNAAVAIAAELDHETTRLCDTTPIGAAIETAGPQLQAIADPEHDQFVVLLTDGNETCGSSPREAIGDLAAGGISTYVVGFGDSALSGSTHRRLNRLACAGRTALGFPAPCELGGGGDYDAANPGGPALYLAAEGADALDDALAGVAGEVCCGSACDPEG